MDPNDSIGSVVNSATTPYESPYSVLYQICSMEGPFRSHRAVSGWVEIGLNWMGQRESMQSKYRINNEGRVSQADFDSASAPKPHGRRERGIGLDAQRGDR